ncbi:MAG: hypothetical protein K6F88_06710, partial [Ruminococcus sp.]|nr:hypothetical protein [Ruminococcus sp.]
MKAIKKSVGIILALLMVMSVVAGLSVSAAEIDNAEVGASYNLWLGSTQVTDANKDDILNDGGKAKFYPSTNTLLLNNPYIRGFYNNYCTIYASGINLMISGSYQMSSEGPYLEAGIHVENGTLFLNGDFAFYGSYWGIKVVNGDLSIERGTLKAQESNMGALYLDTDEQRFFHTPYFGILCEGGQLLIKDDVECVDLYSAEMYSDDQWGATVGADNIVIADSLSI